MITDFDNIYYCNKNQVGGLCVGGDMVILFVGLFHGKMNIFPRTQKNIFTKIRFFSKKHFSKKHFFQKNIFQKKHFFQKNIFFKKKFFFKLQKF